MIIVVGRLRPLNLERKKIMDESTKAAIDELAKQIAAMTSSLAVQLIETQAVANVILDLERERLIADGRTRQDVLQYIERSFHAHRTAAYKLVQARLQLHHIQVDLDATDQEQ